MKKEKENLKKEYERGFIDGSHTTAQQADEIHDIELKEMYESGRIKAFREALEIIKNHTK